ncbi:MAG: metal-dependent hydrolase [Ignavibacteriae bacterium]|jgi:L-ascorbate metabolism protein UlaG (beta-lactamase superfamily)|nr:metal-dependent hydrolase [Ignavibacteriota bacterium]
MKIKYHGHAFVHVNTDKHNIVLDPFISGNPVCDVKLDGFKCDFIIPTHGHGDNFGDTLELAKNNDALIIAMNEIAIYCTNKGLKAHPMNTGGAFNFPFGRVKLTIAHHSSSLPDGTYAGDAHGVLMTIDGKNIYHAGDTALFYDMKLIGEMQNIDCAFVPIGDDFTMGVDDAVKAVEFINPGVVVPVHYNTFDIIKADAQEFKRKVESIGKKCVIMKPGDVLEI